MKTILIAVSLPLLALAILGFAFAPRGAASPPADPLSRPMYDEQTMVNAGYRVIMIDGQRVLIDPNSRSASLMRQGYIPTLINGRYVMVYQPGPQELVRP